MTGTLLCGVCTRTPNFQTPPEAKFCVFGAGLVSVIMPSYGHDLSVHMRLDFDCGLVSNYFP